MSPIRPPAVSQEHLQPRPLAHCSPPCPHGPELVLALGVGSTGSEALAGGAGTSALLTTPPDVIHGPWGTSVHQRLQTGNASPPPCWFLVQIPQRAVRASSWIPSCSPHFLLAARGNDRAVRWARAQCPALMGVLWNSQGASVSVVSFACRRWELRLRKGVPAEQARSLVVSRAPCRCEDPGPLGEIGAGRSDLQPQARSCVTGTRVGAAWLALLWA